MFYRRLMASVATLFLAVTLSALASHANTLDENKDSDKHQRVTTPVNIAILIQDDLISRVGNELGVTSDFIRSLPAGSRVMIGYITSGTLQVRQPFTNDLGKAAGSLRIPISNSSASPYNPYVEVIEALRSFDHVGKGRNVVLLISDGLDTSRGFDITSAGHTLDLERAIDEAGKRNVAIYSFYAPTVGLTSHSQLAASYGQSSLNRLAKETGGKAFFQGSSSFVTFDSYFDKLRQALNDQYARAY
jgi:hypothetical protein